VLSRLVRSLADLPLTTCLMVKHSGLSLAERASGCKKHSLRDYRPQESPGQCHHDVESVDANIEDVFSSSKILQIQTT
jgi:hypothetical protein